MDPWRLRLFVATIAGTFAGYAWLLATADPRVQVMLALLSGTFLVAGVGLALLLRRQVTKNLLSANIALGAIVHLVAAATVVAADHLWTRGLMFGLRGHWGYFVIGTVGVLAAMFTWARARPRPDDKPPPAAGHETPPDEPAPGPNESLDQAPDWDALAERFAARGDEIRLSQLQTLRRLAALIEDRPKGEVRRAVHQEVMRLDTESAAAAHGDDDDDLLGKVASFFEWGVQKLPELAAMDVPDLLLAQVVAEIRARSDSVEHLFVPHKKLVPIHPINRPSAEEKAQARADAARAAFSIIEANGMRFSEELTAGREELAAFKSVTGIQVVQLEDGRYVTFEGNGRAAALVQAFPDEDILVEVRHYLFDEEDERRRIWRHIARTRKANGIAAQDPP